MNIRDHILAGHYPVDTKGRALVPMRSGTVATICATDGPGHYTLIGFGGTPHSWHESGCNGGLSSLDLLPPPPRKVEVKARGVFGKPSGAFLGGYDGTTRDRREPLRP